MSGALVREADSDVVITRKYDCLGRLIEETETANSKNAVSRYAYTKTDERERYAMVYENEEILSEYYEYDAVGRLVKVYTSTASWQTNNGTEAAGGDDEGSDSEDPDPEPALDPYDFDSYPNLTTYTLKNGNDVLYEFKLVSTSGTELDFDVMYTIDNVPYGVCFADAYANEDMSGSFNRSGDTYVGTFEHYYDRGTDLELVDIFVATPMPSDLSTLSIMADYYVYNGNTVVNSIGMGGVNSDGTIIMYIKNGYFDFSSFYSFYSLTRSTTETLITTYAYDANGNRISMTNANGTSATYTYNKANLVTLVQNMSGEVVLSSHAYTYYLDGNIKTEVVDGDTKTYTYDDLGRLTREVKSGILNADAIVYTYDARGNRATRTQGTATTTYTYDANNRLLAETTGASSKVYSYDANGNTLTVYKDGTLAASYSYGLFGTQDSYTSNAVQYTYYTYRPDGLRHSIGDTIHIWDGANIVADVNGTDITTYFRGINLIYAEEDGEQTYYHFNAHGDIVVLTNASGTKTKTYSYNAFGIEYNPGTYDTNPFRYCGEYFDTVYDLYGPATTIGANGCPLWYVGADVVSFSDATDLNAEINGFQLTGGIGYGVDVHVVESYTCPVGNRGVVQHMGKGALPNKTVYSSSLE